jgi:putative tributyrin esterase
MATFQMNFLSRELGQMTKLSVILPSLTPDDDIKGKGEAYKKGMKYQVLWLLHDYTGDDSDFIKFTNIVRFAEANKLAVIMPCDYNKMYTDWPGSSRFFSYIVKELPKLCQSYFSLSDKREDNFIAGIGMGAEGAMKAALRCPEQYSVVLNISNGFCAPEDDHAQREYWQRLLEEGRIIASPPDDVPESEFDLTAMARTIVAEKKPLPKVIMAWEDQDRLANDKSRKGVQLLRDYGFEVQDEETKGMGRDWDFWDVTLRKAVYEWLPLRRSAILVD